MPVIGINHGADGALYAATGGLEVLDRTLEALPPEAPVVVMIHGFKFSPTHARHTPHSHILSLDPARPDDPRARSWPRALGIDADPRNGLAIAFGWEARGTIWQAYRRAARAGAGLAELVRYIRARRPGPVNIIAHSLGARVTLAALPGLDGGALGRVILLHGAEFRSNAEAALRSPAGATAEIINITSRENDLFDLLFESFVGPHRWRDRALSAGIGRPHPGWLDIQIDATDTRRSLGALGFELPAPTRRICHWAGYTRPGMFALYRALIRDGLPLPLLRRALPETTDPRYSRLWLRPETEVLPDLHGTA